jgi:FkbM family methyltransferase
MLLPRGVDAGMSPHTPFGVRWEDDVAALGEVSLAIDVGANEGQTAARIIQAFPSARVFSYEPVPSTFDVLQRCYAGSKQVTCIRAALAAEPGTASMINGFVSGQNTMLLDAKPDEPTVVVPLTTLAQQAAEHGWGQIDLLKIDTEGFEVEVLRGGLSLLEGGTVRFVLAECDFVARPMEPHAYFPDVLALLEPLGYRVVAFYTAAVDGLGWIWGDVLFMRESLSRQVLFTPNGHPEYIAT